MPEEEVQRATAVKDRHEAELMRLPAVVGAGIAASSRFPGKAAILLYVSRSLSEKESSRFPDDLEGVPVEIQQTGHFVALAGQSVGFSPLNIPGRPEVRQASAWVITSDEQWKSFAAQVFNNPEPPAVDFRTNTVVAIFAGEKPKGGYSVRVTRVVENARSGRGAQATVHYKVAAPPPASMVTQAFSQPYTIVLLHKRFNRVSFEPPLPVATAP
jgi:hypothetical protein